MPKMLARVNVFPPGGFTYTQPETGMKFGGNERFKGQCLLILSHRKGNSLARATLELVAEDLIEATCARLPNLCVSTGGNTTALAAGTSARTVRRCGGCGGRRAKK